MSDSLLHHGLQHARLPFPLLSPGVCSNSHLLNQSNCLIFCCPLVSCLQSFSISVFSNESDLYIRWPKYWSLSFSISPCNEYSGLISFRIDRFDLLAVQWTLIYCSSTYLKALKLLLEYIIYSLTWSGKLNPHLHFESTSHLFRKNEMILPSSYHYISSFTHL